LLLDYAGNKVLICVVLVQHSQNIPCRNTYVSIN
jgi:hypothetical protein